MNNLLFFINKHKNIVYLSLLVLVLVLGLIFHKPIIEGLTSDMIGEYDYLKPVNEIISDDTWKRLMTSMNMVVSCGGPNQSACTSGETQANIRKIKGAVGDVTTDEINYKIQNGYWPWGSYITNAITNVEKKNQMTDAQIQSDIERSKKSNPSRMAYKKLGFEADEKAMNPQPLSYKIYMGFTPPPTAETIETTTGTTTGTNNYYNKLVSAVGTIRGTTGTTATGTTGTTAGTNKYYNEFVSLCKKMNPV